ncbi:MAG: TetR family transcriptional regulator [Mesorhizobium sp.]|nr:MAG: TetR family transcriptional regulator [Mesorhizobium sp.]
MLDDTSIPVAEVARHLGVSRPTLYEYFPRGPRGEPGNWLAPIKLEFRLLHPGDLTSTDQLRVRTHKAVSPTRVYDSRLPKGGG